MENQNTVRGASSSRTTRLALTFLLVGTALFIPMRAMAQVSVGADLVSRYIWRGLDFGEAATIQPGITFSAGNFSIGSWASYGVSSAAGANEHDLFVSYSLALPFGTLGLGVTDYYFPNAGVGFFDLSGDGQGAHWIEPSISFAPAMLPISVAAYRMVHNDVDASTYVQVDVAGSAGDTSLGLSVAMVTGASAFYGTTSAAVTVASISASKEITVSEAFSLPVTVSYILNPVLERSYLTFGVSF